MKAVACVVLLLAVGAFGAFINNEQADFFSTRRSSSEEINQIIPEEASNSLSSEENSDAGTTEKINLIKPFGILPHIAPNPENILFYMYTQQNQKTPIIWTGASVVPTIDTTKETKFIIHGFLENKNRPWYKQLTEAYLEKGDYNVIQVDWSVKSQQIDYADASKSTKDVGYAVGETILKLKLPMRNVHIIGHSLGGQTAGWVGRYIKKYADKLIHRISALDPAEPQFKHSNDYNKLTASNAQVVDVIHTDGGVMGFLKPVGTVDFYPNGGTHIQPGCGLLKGEQIKEKIFACSHTRSVDYFIASINTTDFVAVKCDSYETALKKKCKGQETAIMGENLDTENTKGIFYLKTDDRKPFALGFTLGGI